MSGNSLLMKVEKVKGMGIDGRCNGEEDERVAKLKEIEITCLTSDGWKIGVLNDYTLRLNWKLHLCQ